MYRYRSLLYAAAGMAAALILALLLNGNRLGLPTKAASLGYEQRLFDTSVVHTLDICLDGETWDEFLSACTDKQYIPCDVVLDGKTMPNVALRAKGNSSMMMVSAQRSQRYSFKLEFDHYNSGETYYGLDKLNLNNIVMDDTYMKDFLCYRLMDEFDVDAPLCSYIFVTVNGADWGLYLAVEGVEDAFLRRNYGTEYGALYKPDNISNHKDDASGEMSFPSSREMTEPDPTPSPTAVPDPYPPGFAPAETAAPESSDEPESTRSHFRASREMPTPGGGGSSEMYGSDVKLQYIDDDPDSYPNIFDSAKTEIGEADKLRLIRSLKALSLCDRLDEILDMDEILRYFTAHIFVCNNDSYTGGMIHNYYLYESSGRLSMIPWDYNLAFGEQNFASSATAAVNAPIDTPVSGTTGEDRPMIAWVFSDPAYTALYHDYFDMFLRQFGESGRIDQILEDTRSLIAPYVARDPTKFCTYEEFCAAAEDLGLFCRLRTQSIRGQLDGSIPSTREGQAADDSTLTDASELDNGTLFSASGGPSGSQESRSEASQRP